MRKEPLWLPRGSVRSILALGSVAALVGAVFAGVSGEGIGVLAGLANAAMLFYFKDRGAPHTP